MHDTALIIDTSNLRPFEPVAPGPTDVLALSGGVPAVDEARRANELRAMYGLPARPTTTVATTSTPTMTELRALYGLRRK